MPFQDTPGLLLINVGTPDSPSVPDVRRYLREFLSDERVLDTPAWERWLLLNLFILPRRPKASSHAYGKIWTERGSPLSVHMRALAEKLQRRLGDGVDVKVAMRYGNPSIAEALRGFHDRGVRRIVAFPLYPQYSSAATGSSIEKVFDEASQLWNVPAIHVVPPFYDHPAYIDACVEKARPVIDEARPERVFFSFHGLPERHIRKSDRTGRHCLAHDRCCDRIVDANADCYRAQCFATARLLGDRLGVPQQDRVVCFQSRLGRDPWIRPYTDELIVQAAKHGVRRAVILSSAFVADCLETLEELGIRAANDFRAAGGERLWLAPAPNSSDTWVEAVLCIAREASAWLAPPRARAADARRPAAVAE